MLNHYALIWLLTQTTKHDKALIVIVFTQKYSVLLSFCEIPVQEAPFCVVPLDCSGCDVCIILGGLVVGH